MFFAALACAAAPLARTRRGLKEAAHTRLWGGRGSPWHGLGRAMHGEAMLNAIMAAKDAKDAEEKK